MGTRERERERERRKERISNWRMCERASGRCEQEEARVFVIILLYGRLTSCRGVGK